MLRSQPLQRMAVTLGFTSIGALPFLFVRLFKIHGFQISVFHITAVLFMGVAALTFGLKSGRRTSAIEKAVLAFTGAVFLYALFQMPQARGLAIFIKLAFYVLYFRLLTVTLSSLPIDYFLGLLKKCLLYSTIFFGLNLALGYSISAWGIPFPQRRIPDKSQMIKVPESLQDAPQKQLSILYNFTVPSLTAFDEFWPAQIMWRSSHIGVNSLAGAFVLYLNMLLLLPNLKKTAKYAGVAGCVIFIVLLDSRATLMLLGCIAGWLTLVWCARKYTVRQILVTLGALAGISLFIMAYSAFLPAALEAVTESGRFTQYTNSIAQIFEHPLLGKGLGAKLLVKDYEVYPHNFILSSWLMMGLLGLATSLALLATLVIILVHALIKGLRENREHHLLLVSPIFLFPPILTLLIRSSVESIFMLSDWISLAVFILLVQQGAKGQPERNVSAAAPGAPEAGSRTAG